MLGQYYVIMCRKKGLDNCILNKRYPVVARPLWLWHDFLEVSLRLGFCRSRTVILRRWTTAFGSFLHRNVMLRNLLPQMYFRAFSCGLFAVWFRFLLTSDYHHCIDDNMKVVIVVTLLHIIIIQFIRRCHWMVLSNLVYSTTFLNFS